ncbi:MAG: hypothetical protein PSV13_18370 [Lacunisphaera sp.]|nr:hypothetical protein [Lacunisphaera sp.]
MNSSRWIARLFALLAGSAAMAMSESADNRYAAELGPEGALQLSRAGGATWNFRPEFTVLIAPEDPKLAMRPAGIPRVSYNVPTWETRGAADQVALKNTKRSEAQAGDGFDDRILEGDTRSRTADLFASAPAHAVKAVRWERAGDTIRYTFADHPAFALSATVTLSGDARTEPTLAYTITPKIAAWFSVGYTGAPKIAPSEADEFWQPFIWQEKRFPAQSFMTPGYECPIPTTFVRQGASILGVVVDSSEFPFNPLPLLENSRFGVALRTPDGAAQPMVFAPLLGGEGSKRTVGDTFTFKLRLYVGVGEATLAYEDIARRLYGFRDYRTNAISSLNETLDRMIDYGMSDYSWFIDELKGCAYSTDVPGAVKNVSALNPLNLALVADDERIFSKRAYPIAEYLLSREKFLFSLDPEQKIQSPSRALKGPSAPISEIAALYGITHGASPVFRRLAETELGRTRTLNLDDASPGDTWSNNLHVYRSTGDERLLAKARAGADAYLAGRMAQGADGLNEGGLFFWTGFTPKWIDLLELYEVTRDVRYLAAARLGARRYTMFTWMAPQIPDELVTVNPGGNAPAYWYLKSKGHKPMHAPEEKVPAWRLSEIGLTPESSGTMSGHRAIFMANFAPWMLRIAALTGDQLLHDVARSAVIGRYRNFPGYHINTARTTIYEQADYPLRPHLELSVNSFHYNHIWPHMSILLDYLVTDAFARSRGEIDFPSRFIEGYAYLQSKFYGDRPGKFSGFTDATLWMPQRLLKTGSVELNHLTARGDGRLYIAFTNQSREAVSTEVVFNPDVLPAAGRGTYRVKVIADGRPAADATLAQGRFPVSVSPMGITAVVIEGLAVAPKFQHKLLAAAPAQAWQKDYAEIAWGGTRAMILNFGPAAKTAYVYLQADDAKFKEVTLRYETGGRKAEITDAAYPFEFTVPLPEDATSFGFQLTGRTVDGRTPGSETVTLEK